MIWSRKPALTSCLLEIPMKKIALAAALSLATTSAFAGGAVEPVMEPEVVAAQTTSSSGGVVIPLLLLLLVVAAAASSSGGSDPVVDSVGG